MTTPRSLELFDEALSHEQTMREHLEADDFAKAEVFEAARDETFASAIAHERKGS